LEFFSFETNIKYVTVLTPTAVSRGEYFLQPEKKCPLIEMLVYENIKRTINSTHNKLNSFQYFRKLKVETNLMIRNG